MGRAFGNGLIAGGAGLVGLYAFEAARHKRMAAKGFTVPRAPRVGDPDFARVIESLTGAPVRAGNRATVLRNGSEIFPAMLEAIKAAKHTVDFATFVYWTGSIAPEFAHALCERARSGVEVNVLLDALGAAKMDRSLLDELERAGASVAWFRPVRWHTMHKVNNRTHRKILVVDGGVGFTGGVGIAEEWTGNSEDPGHWRDTHVRVEGPIVRDLLSGFQENWSEAMQTMLTGAHVPELSAFADGVIAHVTRSSAAKGSTEAEQLFYMAIASAKERLWLTTAYFAPRTAFIDALGRAVQRGVDVRILVNGPHIDKEVVRQAGRDSYERLLELGVRIFEYQRTMLHAKTLVIDGVWSTIGSINFDNRSFALNDELNISFWDAAIAEELESQFRADLCDAREVDAVTWSKRPLGQKARERLSAVLRREL